MPVLSLYTANHKITNNIPYLCTLTRVSNQSKTACHLQEGLRYTPILSPVLSEK
jgi:hypothetical protein